MKEDNLQVLDLSVILSQTFAYVWCTRIYLASIAWHAVIATIL